VNEQHPWYKATEHFEQILEDRSGGRIQVEVFHSEQLAKEIEAIRLIQADVIDMCTTGSMLSNWIDIVALCDMPFLFSDSTEMRRVIEGPIGKQMEEEMIAKTGMRPIAILSRGPRHLTSNRPIRHPDDLNGFIVRVPNLPTFITAWEALGAKPTPMAFSEVFTSLQQGTIEGQENPFALIRAAGFSEVQQYINLTAHVQSWNYIVIGEKQYQRLPADLKKIFDQAADDMERYHHQIFLENERKVQLELQEMGMELIAVDNQAFKEKASEAIYQSLTPEMQAIYRQIKAANQQ
jgi:tripartite ATP-independent transporter DctP family solute receptor